MLTMTIQEIHQAATKAGVKTVYLPTEDFVRYAGKVQRSSDNSNEIEFNGVKIKPCGNPPYTNEPCTLAEGGVIAKAVDLPQTGHLPPNPIPHHESVPVPADDHFTPVMTGVADLEEHDTDIDETPHMMSKSEKKRLAAQRKKK